MSQISLQEVSLYWSTDHWLKGSERETGLSTEHNKQFTQVKRPEI